MLHGTEVAPVRHARLAPHPQLRFAIEHFWSVEWDLRGRPPVHAQTLPHPSIHVTVEGPRAEVAGVFTTRFTRTLTGKGRVFGIKFRPAMFHAVYGAPVSELANRVVSMHSVFGRPGSRLAKALAGGDFESGVEPAEAFLRERVRDDEPLAREMRDLVEAAANDRALVKVEQLASRAGVTKRTLQRYFERLVGVKPKWVLQRYRLHEANERLKRDPNVDLAALALELGYGDQPHFARDFKAVVGVAPGAYAALVKADRGTKR